MRALWTLLNSEPVMVKELIAAAIALGVAFGLQLSPEQQGSIMAFVTISLGLVARSRVSPIGEKDPQ